MTTKGKLALTVVVLVVGVGLTGCGKDRSTEPPPPANPFVGLPFVLVPGPDGNLEPRTPRWQTDTAQRQAARGRDQGDPQPESGGGAQDRRLLPLLDLLQRALVPDALLSDRGPCSRSGRPRVRPTGD
jgi:hypothetical protein